MNVELKEANVEVLKKIINDVKRNIDNLKGNAFSFRKKIHNRKIDNRDGISYLTSKYTLILSYTHNLLFYMLLKLKGIVIKSHPIIKQLISQRMILEKIQPIDDKMDVTIKKLIKLSSNSENFLVDSTHHNLQGVLTNVSNINNNNIDIQQSEYPNENKMADYSSNSDSDSEGDYDGDGDGDGEGEGGFLKISKKDESENDIISTLHESKGFQKLEKMKRERLAKRLEGSNIIREMEYLYTNKPMELPIIGSEAIVNEEDDPFMKNLIDFEDNNMKRVSRYDKKIRKKERSIHGSNNFNAEIDAIGDFRMVLKANEMMKSNDPIDDKDNNKNDKNDEIDDDFFIGDDEIVDDISGNIMFNENGEREDDNNDKILTMQYVGDGEKALNYIKNKNKSARMSSKKINQNKRKRISKFSNKRRKRRKKK